MYAFYDFETTGTSPAFDQPLQFAAILTDDDFNTIETIDLRCRLTGHILPSPIALAITGVGPDDLLNQPLSSYEFSRKLSGIIDRWAPATWVGYNSLKFDENVFRHLFYQNLEPTIYKTQFDGNKRLDILKMVIACWAFDHTELKIPQTSEGKQTAKLDQLAPLNGFIDHNAHDALGDVRATIHIAKLIRDQIPEIWNTALNNLNKNNLMSALQEGTIYNFVDRFSGPPRIYTGVFCGINNQNKNRIGFFDLDAANAADFNAPTLDLVADAVTKSPKIIREIDVGAMPLLFPVREPNPEYRKAARIIFENHDLPDIVGDALAGRFSDREAAISVESQIFDGFYQSSDVALLNKFHASPWVERSQLIEQLADQRLRVLGKRLVILHSPEHATHLDKDTFWQEIRSRWDGTTNYGDSERSPGTTYESIAADMQKLKPGGNFEVSPETFSALQLFYEHRRL